MKTESLNALLIDRELGELSAEAAELLEAWLAGHPDSAEAVPSIRRTIETTGLAVRRFPELIRAESATNVLPVFRLPANLLALAASVLILVCGSVWFGFRAGRESARQTPAENQRGYMVAAGANPDGGAGPWARYALVANPHGGLTVVRRNTHPQP